MVLTNAGTAGYVVIVHVGPDRVITGLDALVPTS